MGIRIEEEWSSQRPLRYLSALGGFDRDHSGKMTANLIRELPDVSTRAEGNEAEISTEMLNNAKRIVSDRASGTQDRYVDGHFAPSSVIAGVP